jgi:hypothetical protein
MRVISFLSCLLVFTFYSRRQKINLDKDFNDNRNEVIYSMDTSFDKFASKFAISLQNKAILNFVKREAIKQEDGDYDSRPLKSV